MGSVFRLGGFIQAITGGRRMNRAERKRLEREQKKSSKVRILTNEQLRYEQDKVRDEATLTAKKVFMAVMLNSLHANYKFGKKRLGRVVNDMYGQLLGVGDGTVQATEILDMAIGLNVDNWMDD